MVLHAIAGWAMVMMLRPSSLTDTDACFKKGIHILMPASGGWPVLRGADRDPLADPVPPGRTRDIRVYGD